MEETNKLEVSLEDELCIITTRTLYELYKRNPDAVTLYMFYYYTGKRQKTNQPKAVGAFVRKGLRWSDRRYLKAKTVLIELKLIEDFNRVDIETKQITGWYIKLNFIWGKKATHVVSTGVDLPPSGFGETNALSANKVNALSANKKIQASSQSSDGLSGSSLVGNKNKTPRNFANARRAKLGKPPIPKKKPTDKQQIFFDADTLGRFYLDEAQRIHGTRPSFDYAKSGKNYSIAKKRLKEYGLEKCKEFITFHLMEDTELGIDFSICLSSHIINKQILTNKKQKHEPGLHW